MDFCRKKVRNSRNIAFLKAASHNCVAQNAQKIFRQIDQKAQTILGVLMIIFGKYDGIIGKQDA